ADDIVVTGSPGMHVPTADHLNITDGHLWVAMAENDWMRAGGDPANGYGADLHDTDPHTPEFTGQRVDPTRFRVEPGGDPFAAHSSYWGGDGEKNQALIIAGRYDQVGTVSEPPSLAPRLQDADPILPDLQPGGPPRSRP
ncbi:MAG: hypothetical protein H7Y15_18795, partial [Pseudonocardia sp.]|nr:hypothetical protein [Pseudonocardia sp.]